jgi:hypothetical protein
VDYPDKGFFENSGVVVRRYNNSSEAFQGEHPGLMLSLQLLMNLSQIYEDNKTTKPDVGSTYPVVSSIEKDGIADSVGMCIGDVLVNYDENDLGWATQNNNPLSFKIESSLPQKETNYDEPPSKLVYLTIYRKGDVMECVVPRGIDIGAKCGIEKTDFTKGEIEIARKILWENQVRKFEHDRDSWINDAIHRTVLNSSFDDTERTRYLRICKTMNQFEQLVRAAYDKTTSEGTSYTKYSNSILDYVSKNSMVAISRKAENKTVYSVGCVMHSGMLGAKQGDIIVEINGEKVAPGKSLEYLLSKHGSNVQLSGDANAKKLPVVCIDNDQYREEAIFFSLKQSDCPEAKMLVASKSIVNAMDRVLIENELSMLNR